MYFDISGSQYYTLGYYSNNFHLIVTKIRESKPFDEAAQDDFLFSFLHGHHRFRTCAFLHLPQNVHD